MAYFRNVVFVAAIAGLFAGIVMTVMQQFTTVPLILQAEVFESAGGGHHHEAPAADAAGGVTTPAPAAGHDHGQAAHDHGEEAWGPADGFERSAYSALANLVGAIGFGLVLVAASEFAGGIGSWREGMFWGLAGFVCFTLAPGIGLVPELPAMPAADLMARQTWWIGTVAATAGGLALLFFQRSAPAAAIGIALIVAPHIIGAPLPVDPESPIPENLHRSFVVASTMTNLVFWVILGAAAGIVRARFAEPEVGTRRSFA